MIKRHGSRNTRNTLTVMDADVKEQVEIRGRVQGGNMTHL